MTDIVEKWKQLGMEDGKNRILNAGDELCAEIKRLREALDDIENFAKRYVETSSGHASVLLSVRSKARKALGDD